MITKTTEGFEGSIKIGRANGDEPFTFVVFVGHARRLIPVAHL